MIKRRDADTVVNVVISSIFCFFTFLYLYFFQNDLLAYAQYILSEGTTTYNSLVGAFIITCFLLCVSFISAKTVVKNLSFFPIFFHLPSILILASVTDVHFVDKGEKNVFGCTWIAALIILSILLIINALAKNINKIISLRNVSVIKEISINLFILFFMLILAVISANTSYNDHLILREERLINAGKFIKATKFLENCKANNPTLTVLKAFSLAKSNDLGESFFEGPIVGGSENLIPLNKIQLKMISPYTIFKELGGVPANGLYVREYLEIMDRKKMISSIGKEYLLTACLMDCDLDGFVKYYVQYYDTTRVVPKHYKEALVLYAHLRSKPIAVYSFPEVEADFDDFKATKKQYPEKTLSENVLRDTYGNTYWYYYFFTTSSAFTQSVSKEN